MECRITENIGLVYKIIRGLEYIPHQVDEDDLVQIGRIALWRAFETYKEQTPSFTTYAYKLIYSDIISHLRMYSAQKRKNIVKESDGRDFTDRVNLKVAIEEAGLTEDEYKVLKSKYFDNLTYDEISDKHDISYGRVQYMLSKAKAKIKRELEPTYEHDGQK